MRFNLAVHISGDDFSLFSMIGHIDILPKNNSTIVIYDMGAERFKKLLFLRFGNNHLIKIKKLKNIKDFLSIIQLSFGKKYELLISEYSTFQNNISMEDFFKIIKNV